MVIHEDLKLIDGNWGDGPRRVLWLHGAQLRISCVRLQFYVYIVLISLVYVLQALSVGSTIDQLTRLHLGPRASYFTRQL